MTWRLWRWVLTGMAVLAAALSAVGTGAGVASAATSTGTGATAVSKHVVIVGISGLRWTDVSAAGTPALWQVASGGSPGSLVDYAILPHTCPADAWLTMNAGNRARVQHGEKSPCPALPAVTASGGQATAGQAGAGQAGAGQTTPARIAAMPALTRFNRQFHTSPQWGLLASAAGAGQCATAVGPGAALALAKPDGQVSGYRPALPGTAAADRQLLASCPLTVIDLGSLPSSAGAARTVGVRHADAELSAITAALPAGTTLMVTAPGAATNPPHLQVVAVSGPGYRSGVLDAESTRQPGMVVLTDLTPTVLGWRGQTAPADVVGSRITRASRGAAAPAVASLIGQDTAAQVWTSTHTIFFWTYALVDAFAFIGIGLLWWGAQAARRRRRAGLWRIAGTFAAAVPAGSFLANLVPWWLWSHPALWLYGLTVAWTALIGAGALAGPWRRDPFGPPAAVAAVTVAVVGIDVMTGSRLQMGTPFGLSVLEAGRFYGIGGEAVGLYAVCGILAAAWAGQAVLRRSGDGRPGDGRGRAVLAALAVAVFAVAACGWPQFGGKVGGTIAMVPGFILLLMALAQVRITARRVIVTLGSGLALFLVFALINYLVPATGHSDIGVFAGNLLHGRAGGLLTRKATSMLGSLAVTAYSPVVPVVLILIGLTLLKPGWFRVRVLPRAYAAEPLMAVTLAMMWLVAVLGWFADDSGIIVPATALPLALPLGIALLAGVPLSDDAAAGPGSAVTGSSVAGRIG
ncbi:MAG TPA: hypothetical protein VG268_08090 [Streptosporangiaceae bacterium]|nr:hypothetical protein [Streptosporangiaceae bacterium]